MKALRKATTARIRKGASIGLGGGMCRWWDITLECGHQVERPVRFPKQTGFVRRGFAAIYHKRALSEALPAPKRCRCEICPDRVSPVLAPRSSTG